MPEWIGLVILLIGLAIGTIGWFWLILNAFRQHLGWGLAVLLFPPTVLVFLGRHFGRTRGPLALMLTGAVVAAVPYAVNAYYLRHIDFGPRERLVDGELHLTLTGWDQSDYSVLSARPQTVVLQMANADVTDETLTFLRPMTGLRELDLNGTQVTDRGLEVLKGLSNLRIVRLRGTHITDEGFQELAARLPDLTEVDARETAIKASTLRTWKKHHPERKYLR